MKLNADATTEFGGRAGTARLRQLGSVRDGVHRRGGDCTATVVTMVAPASSTNMGGTWSASSGRKGTFSATKQ